MNVLIVGAGPTGLTAAIELARQGIIPDIVEKRTEPSELSRAVGIMPETIEKLRPSGAGDAIEKESMHLSRIMIYNGNSQLLNVDFTTLSNQPVRTMFFLPQNRTESLMAEALEKYGVTVRYGCEVTEVETTDQHTTVHFSNANSKTYNWVIAADGRDSIVREQLGIKYPGIDLDGDWSIADVDVSDYDPSVVSLWIQDQVDHNGVFTLILPIEPNRVRIVSSTPDALANMAIKLDIRNVRRTGTFNIAIRQAETYKKGRVLLTGDAAHCHSPVGGRGMNLGIDDAVAAAKAIINGTTDEYSDARHAIGAKVLQISERLRKIITSRNIFTWLLTKLFMFLLGRSQFMQQKMLKQLTTL